MKIKLRPDNPGSSGPTEWSEMNDWLANLREDADAESAPSFGPATTPESDDRAEARDEARPLSASVPEGDVAERPPAFDGFESRSARSGAYATQETSETYGAPVLGQYDEVDVANDTDATDGTAPAVTSETDGSDDLTGANEAHPYGVPRFYDTTGSYEVPAAGLAAGTDAAGETDAFGGGDRAGGTHAASVTGEAPTDGLVTDGAPYASAPSAAGWTTADDHAGAAGPSSPADVNDVADAPDAPDAPDAAVVTGEAGEAGVIAEASAAGVTGRTGTAAPLPVASPTWPASPAAPASPAPNWTPASPAAPGSQVPGAAPVPPANLVWSASRGAPASPASRPASPAPRFTAASPATPAASGSPAPRVAPPPSPVPPANLVWSASPGAPAVPAPSGAPATGTGPRAMPAPPKPAPADEEEITVGALIGDELRTPMVWCELEPGNCVSWHADREALGVADVRARAIAAGWRIDAMGRLTCPLCQQRSTVFRATQQVVLWDRAYALTMAAREAARQGQYPYPQPAFYPR